MSILPRVGNRVKRNIFSSASRIMSSMREKRIAIPAIIGLLLVINVFDFITGPELNLTVLYFLPIFYTAWSFGRWALLIVLIAEFQTYTDQLVLMKEGNQTLAGAISTIIVRLLAFLFAAEVTIRLARSNDEARRTLRELSIANEELQETYTRLDEDVAAGGLLQQTLLEFVPPVVAGLDIGAKRLSTRKSIRHQVKQPM